MFFKNNDNERKLKALLQEHEALNDAIASLFKEWDITEETLSRFNQLKEQFTPQDWDALNQAREKLKSLTDTRMSDIKNPKELEQRYKERQVQPHWLFVR